MNPGIVIPWRKKGYVKFLRGQIPTHHGIQHYKRLLYLDYCRVVIDRTLSLKSSHDQRQWMPAVTCEAHDWWSKASPFQILTICKLPEHWHNSRRKKRRNMNYSLRIIASSIEWRLRSKIQFIYRNKDIPCFLHTWWYGQKFKLVLSI